MEHPFLLFSGSGDGDFQYATGFAAEGCGYLGGPGAGVLITSALEVDRARSQSRVGEVVDRRDLGWTEADGEWSGLARVLAKAASDRGIEEVAVSPRLPAALYEALPAAGLRVRIDPELLVAERRSKSKEEQGWIHAAQRAAEAACVEVVGQIARAEIHDGLLWRGGTPLTSEHLMAAAVNVLEEIGYEGGQMIIAGSPGCALPHFRGEGQLRAGAPIILDIFPRGRTSGYFGDLTRTVIAGDISDRWRQVSDAVLTAFDAALPELHDGGDGQAAHRAACEALVAAGFGTTTQGLEGRQDGPMLIHSLGHGVGLDVHEPPGMRDQSRPLQTGDVVTVEPGLYELGQGGVRWEDLGVITPSGFQNFTSLPKSLDPADYV